MLDFIRPLFEIAFFKRSPETLPSSVPYVYSVVLTAFLVGCGVLTINGELNARFLLLFCASLFILAGSIWAILNFVNKVERFNQTFAASVGSDAAINIMLLPAVFSISNYPEDSMAFFFGGMALLLSLVWSIAVFATILKEATEMENIFCIIIAVCINLFMLMLPSIL